MRTIDRVKKKFIEEGLEAVLERRPTARVYEKKMDGDTEAKLITLCCKRIKAKGSICSNYPKCFDNRRASATRVRTGLAAELNGITDMSQTYRFWVPITRKASSTTELD